jgi:hypothetical protein
MTVTRNVRDIDAAGRNALERVLGGELADDQQIVISVQSSSAKASAMALDATSKPSSDVVACVLQITRDLFGENVGIAEDCDPDSPSDRYVVLRVEVPDPESAVRLESEWLSKVRCFSSQPTSFRLSLSVNA